MKTFLAALILFLMGFIPEILLLKLDDGWKLLGLAYPIAAFAAAARMMARIGAVPQGCGMPGLIFLVMISPFFAGIGAAVVLWLLTWILRTVPRWLDRTIDRLLDFFLKDDAE